MTEIDPSARRLDAALKRLEGALDSLMSRTGDPVVTRAELSALVADRARMAEELDGSLAREEELQALADEASEALGAAIAEVRAALGQDEGAEQDETE
jgi:ABC-type transporter Mla subunit MlaD